MRDYGKVLPAFWTRGSGKALRGDALGQVVALYLFTCPAATMTGLFYLGLPTMSHETGHTIADVRDALRRVSAAGIAKYDEGDELIWLPEMARIQVGETLTQNDKRAKGIVREVSHYKGHRFFDEFVARYHAPFGLGYHGLALPQGPSRQSEGPSKGLPGNGGPHPRGIPQEQEQVQDHDQGTGAKQENIPVGVSQDPRAPASQEPRQNTHTQSAESYEMPTLPDAEWLAAELRRYPAIDRFAADVNLVADLAGGLQAKMQTVERAREIVADFVTKTGIEARSMDRAEFQRRLGGFVTSARLRGPHVRPVEQKPTRAPPKLCASFARGHEAHGAAGYPVPHDPRDEAALAAVVAARCPTLTGDEAANWITHAVQRFLRARDADPDSQYWKGGTGVQGFVNWIGTEKKADAQRAEVLRLVANVPKMTDDELLEYDRKQREERRNAAMVKPPDTPTVRRVVPDFPNPFGVTRTRP